MRYHHILDPRTGQPARAARSVTVYAKDATTADGLDDAVLILGPERGLPLIESYPDAGAIVVDAKTASTSQSACKVCVLFCIHRRRASERFHKMTSATQRS